jgi:hypothetical protein
MKTNQIAKAYRQKLLKRIINSILSGDFDSSEVDYNELFQVHGPARHEYKSPVERSEYNYGYETIGEMGAGNVYN